MKYRKLDVNGDHQFGRAGIFWQDQVEAVAQAITTRLKLWTNEWFLDLSEGTPYDGQILGHHTQGTRDLALKKRIVETPGVTELLVYESNISGRSLSVFARVATQFGSTDVTVVI